MSKSVNFHRRRTITETACALNPLSLSAAKYEQRTLTKPRSIKYSGFYDWTKPPACNFRHVHLALYWEMPVRDVSYVRYIVSRGRTLKYSIQKCNWEILLMKQLWVWNGNAWVSPRTIHVIWVSVLSVATLSKNVFNPTVRYAAMNVWEWAPMFHVNKTQSTCTHSPIHSSNWTRGVLTLRAVKWRCRSLFICALDQGFENLW